MANTNKINVVKNANLKLSKKGESKSSVILQINSKTEIPSRYFLEKSHNSHRFYHNAKDKAK